MFGIIVDMLESRGPTMILQNLQSVALKKSRWIVVIWVSDIPIVIPNIIVIKKNEQDMEW